MFRSKRNVIKKILASIAIVLLQVSILPVAALGADNKTPPPEEPYQKVVFKQGNWYSEYMNYEGSTHLIIGYQGDRKLEATQLEDKTTAKAPLQLSLKSKTLLRGVYLPLTYPAGTPTMKEVNFWLEDKLGNKYGPWTIVPTPVLKVVEMSFSSKEVENKTPSEPVFMDCSFTAEQEIVLPAGDYVLNTTDNTKLVRNKETGPAGAVLMKGIEYSAWQKYKEKLLEWQINKAAKDSQSEKNQKAELTVVGSEKLAQNFENPEKYQANSQKAPTKRLPASILLKESTLIDEIVFNSYNGGKGATPGLITITDKSGKVYGKYQAYGGMLGETPNGVWITAPGIVLPAGDYVLSLPDMTVTQYDEQGYPDFFVSIAPMLPPNYDFTGRYIIDLEAIKTSTLMGPVKESKSSFSLKQFELTVLDQGDTLELIGKYEGMPFSQQCKVVERNENTVKVAFNFKMDLSNLPYKAKIGALGIVTLQKPSNIPGKLDILGEATFDRTASAEKGADHNTYKIVAKGNLAGKDLPAYVAAALGARMPTAGNIPGPDGAAQAAVGTLFPPLAVVVAQVLQSVLKPKPKASKGKSGPRDKGGYQNKYPGKTDEQIAYIMLADAMGNTDEPDDDPLSIGDNESSSPSGNDSSGEGESSFGDPYEGDSNDDADEESSSSVSDSDFGEDSPSEEGKSPENELPGSDSSEAADPSQPVEPETLVLQTDHKGGTTEYVKDPETGEWVNPLTGGVLDPEVYEKVVKPGFEKDKDFINQEFEKNTKGETTFDDEVRKAEAARQKAAAEAEYLRKLGTKYGTSDKKELNEYIGKMQGLDKAVADAYIKAGNLNAGLENAAGAVVVVSDTLIDGMANATGPAGGTIRSGYKVIKGVAGTVAEKGVSTSSFASGLVKGGADAATDYIDNPYTKALVTVGGEAIGQGITDGWEGAAKGAVDGTFKVGVGAITDKVAGGGFGNDMVTTSLKNGSVRVAVKSGDKWIGRVLSETGAKVFKDNKVTQQVGQSLIKGASGLVDEFGIKPGLADPIKDSIAESFKTK